MSATVQAAQAAKIATDEVCLSANGVSKMYPGILALNNVSYQIRSGKVNVLVGENGAGKSTLMKIISGIEEPSLGSMTYLGEEIKLKDTRHAAQIGISIIHQELSFFPQLTIMENMFAGKELRKYGVQIDKKDQYKRAKEALLALNLDVDPLEKMYSLRVGQQQVVEIAKAMLNPNLRVLIMDEPTSSLSNWEVDSLFELIESLKERGVAIVYISHRLEEIMHIGDYISVLRDGNMIASEEVKNIDIPWIVKQMVGHNELHIELTPYAGE